MDNHEKDESELKTFWREDLGMYAKDDQKSNDLYYVCSLINWIGRKKHRTRKDVVNALGRKRLEHIYDLAAEYHKGKIEHVAEDFIKEAGIEDGDFDNVGNCLYRVPTFWEIGRVYQRLIKKVSAATGGDIITSLINMYNSFVSEAIDNYNSSFYYDKPDNHLITYLTGEME